MNRQATQAPTPAERGLPELPASFGDHCVSDSVRTMREPGYTTRQMRDYGRACYEAALSARPLPSDWVAVPPHPTAKMTIAMHDAYKVGNSMVEAYRAMLAAAPSAPAEAVQRRPLSERLYRGPAHPDAHREQYMEGKTAPEPLAQGECVAEVIAVDPVSPFDHRRDWSPDRTLVWNSSLGGQGYLNLPVGTKLYASPQPAAEVNAGLVDHMVNRFLGWKLPTNLHPDGGITFAPRRSVGTEWEAPNTPVGTNLLNAEQAKEMFLYCIEGHEAELEYRTILKLGKLLSEIAVIVNGPEPPLTSWSWHDLPEKVRALKAAPNPPQPSASVGDDEPEPEDWRIGWALAYAGWALYTDDGELQDNRESPFIDFRRDDAALIRKKIAQRAIAKGRYIESAALDGGHESALTTAAGGASK